MNHLRALFFLLLNSLTTLVIAQRPLPISEVKPTVDLIQTEVDKLYRIYCLVDNSLHFLENKGVFNVRNTEYVTRWDNDTSIFIYKNEVNDVAYSFKYWKTTNFFIKPDSVIAEISNEEAGLIEKKQIAIEEAKKAKYHREISKISQLAYLFYQSESGFTLYSLCLPKIDSIINFGNDMRFDFDLQMNLLSYQLIGRSSVVSIKKKDNPYGSELMSISAPVGIRDNDFKLLIPYFFKFKKFHQNIGLNEMSSTINKRHLKYNAVENEVSIKLFPNER